MAEPLVLGLVPDLMFSTQIAQALQALGYRVEFARDPDALVARAREANPPLILVDLAARGVDSAAAIAALKADPATRSVPVVAFGPHLDEAARAAARGAGADAVVANSKLAFDLPGLVARYARPIQA
jgi:CheY-like chemotaxis protein